MEKNRLKEITLYTCYKVKDQGHVVVYRRTDLEISTDPLLYYRTFPVLSMGFPFRKSPTLIPIHRKSLIACTPQTENLPHLRLNLPNRQGAKKRPQKPSPCRTITPRPGPTLSQPPKEGVRLTQKLNPHAFYATLTQCVSTLAFQEKKGSHSSHTPRSYSYTP